MSDQAVSGTRQLTSRQGKAFGGGTFQCRNTSPDNRWECEGSDVGGVRRRQTGQLTWENMPTAGSDADRKVAGVIILNDGSMFTLVGNGKRSGRILEYAADGLVNVIAKNLNVRANSKSPGDKSPRTRPVGWLLHFDSANNVLYACTGDGLYRHYRDKPKASGIIALNGESLRGFVHSDSITVGTVSDLTICTQTQGVVRVNDVQKASGKPSVTPIGTPTRAEDGAFTPGGNILAACQFQGLHLINPQDGTSIEITPFEVIDTYKSKGANKGQVSWAAVDCHPDTGIGVATMINPTHSHGWVWRSTVPIDVATEDHWESITHSQIGLKEGLKYVQPKERIPGGSAKNGKGLTGGQHISFLRNDRTGNSIKTLNTLVSALTTNAMTEDHSDVTWVSDQEGSSLLTMLDVAVSDAGVVGIAVSDHNSMVAQDITTTTDTEPKRLGVSGLGDAYAINVVGETWVFAPAEDHDWKDPDSGWRYFNGPGAPTKWTSVGWETFDWNRAADFPAGLKPLPGVPPRCVSVCGHNNGDGTQRFFGMADGIGMVYQDYTPGTDKWSDPKISQGGPVNDDVISKSQNTTRSSTCNKDGSLVLHQMQINGHIYRSLNRGVNVERIATGSNGPEIAAKPRIRTGYMRLNEAENYAVVSNQGGVYVISNLKDARPKVTQLSQSETGPIALDEATNTTYIHIGGTGRAKLLRFDDITKAANLNSGQNIASVRYSTHMGDQANQLYALNYKGEFSLITLYQGGGFLVSTIA